MEQALHRPRRLPSAHATRRTQSKGEFWSVYRTVANALDSRHFEAIEQKWPSDWTPELFSKYLKQQGFGVQADVAALEWALHELRNSTREQADLLNPSLLGQFANGLKPSQLEKLHVVVAEHFRLVATDWDVGGYFLRYPQPSANAFSNAPEMKPGRGYFLAYLGVDDTVRIRKVEAFEFKLLGLLQKRCGLSKACDILLQSDPSVDIERIAEQALGCIRQWHELGILKDLDFKISV